MASKLYLHKNTYRGRERRKGGGRQKEKKASEIIEKRGKQKPFLARFKDIGFSISYKEGMSNVQKRKNYNEVYSMRLLNIYLVTKH